MKLSGEIVEVGVNDEEYDHPKSKDLLYILSDSLLEMAAAGACKATAQVFDVRVMPPNGKDKSDAVQIRLEHADGYSAEVFLPYQIDEVGGVTFGAMFAQEGKHDIFRQSNSS